MLKKIVTGMILILLLSSIFAIYYAPTAQADFNSYAPPPDSRLSMATSSDGYLYVVYDDWWSSTSSYILWLYRSADQGLTWTYFGRWYDMSYGKNISNPSMAIDPYDNMIYVAYEYEYSETDHDIYCLVINPATMSFNSHRVDDETPDTRYPSITCEYEYGATAGGNYQYISYERLYNYDSNDRDLIYANSSGTKGTTWSYWTVCGLAPDANVYTQSCITNAEGYIYIACREATDYGSVGTIRVERRYWSDPPTTWTAFQNVSGLTNNCAFPTIAASHGGDTVVEAHQYDYYSAYHNLDADIWYSYSSDFGNTWSKSHALFATSANETAPALTVDGGGSTATDVRGRFHLVCRVGNWADPNQYIAYTNTYYSTPTAWSTPVRALITSRIAARAVSGDYNYNLAVTTQYRMGEAKYHPCIAWAELAIIRYSSLWQITYNAATNTITVVGGTSIYPVCFTDIWTADHAHNPLALPALQSRAGISGTDASPVAFTTNLRPADKYVLGGLGYDLDIWVSDWTSMTSSTIRLIGTDVAGHVETEDITVTGTGVYYATKYFHTLTSSMVVAWSGSGSYDYSVWQWQWGVVWKSGESSFMFDSRLVIGDASTATYFMDAKKQVVFSSDAITDINQFLIETRDKSYFTLGYLDDAAGKTTHGGCQMISLEATYNTYFGQGSGITSGATMYLYSSSFSSKQLMQIICRYSCRIYTCHTDMAVMISPWGNLGTGVNINNVLSDGKGGSGNAHFAFLSTLTSMTNIFASGAGRLLYQTGSATVTLSTVYARNYSYLFRAATFTGTVNLINFDVDAWTFSWDSAASTGTVYRKYTFDLKVTDSAGNPITGANVTVKDKDSGTIFTVLTDSNGNILTQTVARGFYKQTSGDTLQDRSPHTLTISKSGYTTYTQVFTLTGKTSWQITLS